MRKAAPFIRVGDIVRWRVHDHAYPQALPEYIGIVVLGRDGTSTDIAEVWVKWVVVLPSGASVFGFGGKSFGSYPVDTLTVIGHIKEDADGTV